MYTEYTKYEKNVIHSEAIQTIGNRLEIYLADCAEIIEHYTEEINNKIEENKDDESFDPKCSWQISSWERSILVAKEEQSLWKKLQNLLDKELAF